jgi:beta-lactam-binding protein with PASTA domain
MDSVYSQKDPPGTVVAQNPPPGAKVKKGRKVYLTIVTETPEQVTMPNLIDLTLRQSISLLQTYGLEINQLKYVDDIARNAVLQQLINGKVVEPGEKIFKGTRVDLVLGKGRGQQLVEIPFLLAKKQHDAITLLHLASLNVGEQYFLDSEDTSRLRVYNTFPEIGSGKVRMGSYVDLYFRSDENFDFLELLESYRMDTIAEDSTLIKDSFFEEDIIID